MKDWDPPIVVPPVSLYTHPGGLNRRMRRAGRVHKHDPLPPSSMVPAVKRDDEYVPLR